MANRSNANTESAAVAEQPLKDQAKAVQRQLEKATDHLQTFLENPEGNDGGKDLIDAYIERLATVESQMGIVIVNMTTRTPNIRPTLKDIDDIIKKLERHLNGRKLLPTRIKSFLDELDAAMSALQQQAHSDTHDRSSVAIGNVSANAIQNNATIGKPVLGERTATLAIGNKANGGSQTNAPIEGDAAEILKVFPNASSKGNFKDLKGKVIEEEGDGEIV